MAKTIGAVDFRVEFSGTGLPAKAAALGKLAGEAYAKAFNQAADERAGIAKSLDSLSVKVDNLARRTRRVTNATNRVKKAAQEVSAEWQKHPHIIRESASEVEKLHKLMGVGEKWAGPFSRDGWGDVDEATRRWERFAKETNKASLSTKELQMRLREVKSIIGSDTAYKNWVKTVGDVDEAHDRVIEKLHVLHKNQRITSDEFDMMGTKSQTYVDRIKEAERSIGRKNRRLRDSTLWYRITHSHVMKTVIAWSLLIAIVGQAAAVLGSGLGSSITMLVTALGALVAGIGVTIWAFQGMFDAEKDVVAEAQAAKDAIAGLREELGGLQGRVQGAFFRDLAGSIAALGDAVKGALGDSLVSLAESSGNALQTMLDAMTSDRGSSSLADFFEGAGPVIESAGRAVAGFIQGLLDVFNIAMPYAQSFMEMIAGVGDRFAEWTGSEAGREKITQWFENMGQIMGPVGELAKALGGMLSDLVTPESVEIFRSFIQALTAAVPTFGKIFSVIGSLRILEIVAVLFEAIGETLDPMMEPLLAFGDAVGGVIIDALDEAMPLLEELGVFFGILMDMVTPLLPIFTILVEALVALLVPAMQAVNAVLAPLIPAFAAIGEAIKPVGDLLMFLLVPAIGAVTAVFEALWSIAEPIISALVGMLGGLIDFIVGVFTGDWEKAWGGITKFFGDAFGGAMEVLKVIANGIMSVLEGLVNAGIAIINGLIWTYNNTLGHVFGPMEFLEEVNFTGRSVAGAGGGGAAGGAVFMASGGLVDRATSIVAGEAGPEAIVPLDRPLSMVDPSVRELSAIAQGLSVPGRGGDTIVNVYESSSPRRTALKVVDELFESAVA